MEELKNLSNSHPYSANIQWEIVKRKLLNGTITDEDLTTASLHMKDRRAFFRAVESLRVNTQVAKEFSSETDQDRNELFGHDDSSEIATKTNETASGIANIQSHESVESEGQDISIKSQTDTNEEDFVESDSADQKSKSEIIEDQTQQSQFQIETEQKLVKSDHNTEDTTPSGDLLSEKHPLNTYGEVAASELLLSNHQTSKLSPFTNWLKSLSGSTKYIEAEVLPSKIGTEQTLPNVQGRAESVQKNISEFGDNVVLQKKGAGKKKKKKKKKLETAQELELRPDVISETLADLLASQGHIEDANEMYRRLSMKYPEKSSYFASKIKNS